MTNITYEQWISHLDEATNTGAYDVVQKTPPPPFLDTATITLGIGNKIYEGIRSISGLEFTLSADLSKYQVEGKDVVFDSSEMEPIDITINFILDIRQIDMRRLLQTLESAHDNLYLCTLVTFELYVSNLGIKNLEITRVPGAVYTRMIKLQLEEIKIEELSGEAALTDDELTNITSELRQISLDSKPKSVTIKPEAATIYGVTIGPSTESLRQLEQTMDDYYNIQQVISQLDYAHPYQATGWVAPELPAYDTNDMTEEQFTEMRLWAEELVPHIIPGEYEE